MTFPGRGIGPAGIDVCGSFKWKGIGNFINNVRTRGGAFAGIISHRYNGVTRVWFNSTATLGSARKFKSIQEAAEFIYSRRIKKGWRV